MRVQAVKGREAGQLASGRLNNLRANACRWLPRHRLCRWAVSWVLPGLGMFSEAFFIFSVGNLKPLWAAQYGADAVSQGLLDSLTCGWGGWVRWGWCVCV